MTQRFAIIVTDEKGKFSIHSGWKAACKDYGWEYNKNRPENINGYTILKAPIGVTIDCLELIEFIGRKNVKQCATLEDELIMIEIYSEVVGLDQYTLYCDYHTVTERHDDNYVDGDLESRGGVEEIVELDGVLTAYRDGNEFPLDEYTKEILNKYIKP